MRNSPAELLALNFSDMTSENPFPVSRVLELACSVKGGRGQGGRGRGGGGVGGVVGREVVVKGEKQ